VRATHAYRLNGIGTPREHLMFVQLTIDGEPRVLTVQAAAELADDLRAAACEAEDRSAGVRESLLMGSRTSTSGSRTSTSGVFTPEEADALTDELTHIGSDVQSLAERIGLPGPGAAKTEDLVRDLWAVVHAHDQRQGHGVHVDEGRALGWST